jgi:hypothetical protein
MQLRYRHVYSGAPTTINLVSIGNSLGSFGLWYINPTRNNGFVNASYPLIYNIGGQQYFGMFTFIDLLYNNQAILFNNISGSTQNVPIQINSIYNDPFFRTFNLDVQVNSSGNFINY